MIRSLHSGLEYVIVGSFGDWLLCRRVTSDGVACLHVKDTETI